MRVDYFIVDGVGKTPDYAQAKGAAIERAKQVGSPVTVTAYRGGEPWREVSYDGQGGCARLWKGEGHGTD